MPEEEIINILTGIFRQGSWIIISICLAYLIVEIEKVKVSENFIVLILLATFSTLISTYDNAILRVTMAYGVFIGILYFFRREVKRKKSEIKGQS
jgi:hypothetical protein